jgi:hypothetical protein
MQKRTFIVLLLLTTLAAIAAVWFWALTPLHAPLFYIHPTDWTDADMVRAIWHFRLVQPEWVSSPPDYFLWAQAETLARGIMVLLAWATTAILLEKRYLRSQRNTSPNQAAPGNGGIPPLGNAGCARPAVPEQRR